MLWFPSPASLSPAQDFKLMNSVRKMNDTWIWRKKKEAIWCTWIIKAGSAPNVRRSGSRHHTSTVKALQTGRCPVITVAWVYRFDDIPRYENWRLSYRVHLFTSIEKRISHAHLLYSSMSCQSQQLAPHTREYSSENLRNLNQQCGIEQLNG